tara:strand:- start:987 stop:1247 length:261 start_codon:yes stop_codon:yes gene_type:complete
MGFAAIQTFTLPEEGGASLRGAGWQNVGSAGGGEWSSPSRPRAAADRADIKTKWIKSFSVTTLPVVLPEIAQLPDMQERLFRGPNA